MTARGEGIGFGRFLVELAAVAVLLAAIGFLPTRALAGEHAVVAMVAAIGVVAVASALAALPIALGLGRAVGGYGMMLVSMALRVILVAGLAASIGVGLGLPSTPFLAWIGIAYLAFLAVDTRYLLSARR